VYKARLSRLIMKLSHKMQPEKSEHTFHITVEDGEILIDTAPEERFDRLIRIAKHTFNVPVALICLKDSEQHLWLKSAQGLPIQQFTPGNQSFCHAVMSSSKDVLYIQDVCASEESYDSCCASNTQSMRFYAGIPIILSRQRIGSLCILDYQPRTLNADDLAILADLARCVEVELQKTHQNQLAQLFLDQKEHLSAVLDTIVDGIITIDKQGIIQTVNKATRDIFSYAPEELIGNNVNMLMPEPFHTAHDSYLANYLTTHNAKIIGMGREVQGLRRNGEVFPMKLAVSEMLHGDDKHFVGIIHDITEKKKNQHTLEWFKYTLDKIVDGVFLCTLDTYRFLYVNEGMERQVGYSKKELLTTFLLIIKPVTADSYRELIAPLLNKEKNSMMFETVHRHKNGREILVEVSAQLIQQTGQEPNLLCIVRDITERKALENLKNQFVATVSHELRTPLTSIRGALGLVLGGALGGIPDKVRLILEMANRNSERLTLLINDLLDLEKIESAQMVFAFESVDLIQLVRHALEANQGYADEYGISLQLYTAIDQAWVQADENRLLQVLANLLSNAIKFSHQGDIVSVYVEKKLDNLDNYVVRVQDQGEGIPESFRAHIFERFAQADGGDNRQKGGSGLGLSISKAIVERHQGNIGFISTEGAGSTFFFNLPAQKKLETTSDILNKEVIKDSTDLSPLCILLCKNNNETTALLSILLDEEGLSYDIADTLAEAKALLQERKYTLMVLDVTVPDPSSMDFIHKLRSLPNASDLSIIITSLGENDARHEKLTLPDDMQPPVTRDRLHSALQLALLASHRANILHIEDDLDIITLVKRILSNTPMNYQSATSLADARRFLNTHTVDLVILDIDLPDGSGMELLAELDSRCQVVVFSGHDISNMGDKHIAAVLMKSITNNEQLLTTIRRVLNTTQK